MIPNLIPTTPTDPTEAAKRYREYGDDPNCKIMVEHILAMASGPASCERVCAAIDTILANYSYMTIKAGEDKFTVFVGVNVYDTRIEVSDKSKDVAILKAAEKAIQ